MGLQQNLNDIQTNLLQAKTAIAQSISNKGVECSATDKLSTFASKIDSITTGSTGGTGEKFVVPNGLKFGYSTVFDPSLYDVSNVTDMSFMFYNCSGLTGELDLSTWNTSQVTTMFYMFQNCSKLTSLDVSNWDTSKLTNINNMFNYCSKLRSLDVSNWDTSNISDMFSLFNGCSGLTSLDLSTWNISNLLITSQMFYDCRSLTNLQLPDLGHYRDCTFLDLSSCSALTKDSILYLFNNAFDRTAAGYTKAFTIKLNATTKALLTEDEIAIATNKGFTVV